MDQALLGAEICMGKVAKEAFLRYLRFPFKHVPLPFCPYTWVSRGLHCPRLLLRANWAILFLNSGHDLFRLRPLDPSSANGSGPSIIGPHNSPSNPCCPTPRLERWVLIIPSLYCGSLNSAIDQRRRLFTSPRNAPVYEMFPSTYA